MTIKTNCGGDNSAAIYSVIQTALSNNLKVYEYLAFLFREMPKTTRIRNRLADLFPGQASFRQTAKLKS